MGKRRSTLTVQVTQSRRILIVVVVLMFSVLRLHGPVASDMPAGGTALRAQAEGSGPWRWQAKLPGAGSGAEIECRQLGTGSSLRIELSRLYEPPGAGAETRTQDPRLGTFVAAGCAARPAAADAEPA